MDTGELLGGRYRLTGRIGSGGMGTVYRAHDTRLDRPVAIKTLHGGRDVDDVTRARLRAEARLAGTLRHPGVVQVFDYGEEVGAAGPAPYVVMELVEGTPLSEVLRDRGPLSAEVVATLVGDVARALEAAHAAGIVHRDLKPSNILIAPDGRAVLLDFGIARSDAMEPLTETGLIIGSADYLSPEQVLGERATPASDVFGLGVVAHQSLSAASPFHRDTQAATVLARLHEDAPALPATVPAPLRRLVASMLAREPEDRPSAAEVADRAATVDRTGPVLPPLPVPAPSPAPRQRWNRQRLLVIAAAAVVLAGTLGLLALQHRDVPPAGASELDVPAVVGKQAERAVRILDRAGFEVVLEDAGGDVPGQVVKQSPDPGRYDGTPAVTRPAVTLWVTVAASPPPSPTATPRPEPDEKPPATGAGTGKHDPGSGQGHGADKGPGKGPDNGHGKGPGKKHR
ncbi:serine/threonine protein kinase [Nocardioides sp.]|uniref:serine/threonine protein kinase n=1 Tax=Nocardioides sp. TaxID=35761 RepID=UPI002633CB64|nr:serine/threonine protein kinase [Nocardioides sp.]MDI6910067.1 serine/threonine protein kinase [Nocardioides sp.]